MGGNTHAKDAPCTTATPATAAGPLQRSHQRLKRATTALALAATAVLLAGAASIGTGRFTELDVERINLREADRTLRTVIANRERFPGLYLHNTEYPHDRGGDKSGMQLFNDEGSENGGLIYNGYRQPDGQVSNGLSLTFDRYQQGQQLQLLGVDQGGRAFAGLMFNDVADDVQRPILSEADRAANVNGDYAITQRVFLGKSGSQNAALLLNDGNAPPACSWWSPRTVRPTWCSWTRPGRRCIAPAAG